MSNEVIKTRASEGSGLSTSDRHISFNLGDFFGGSGNRNFYSIGKNTYRDTSPFWDFTGSDKLVEIDGEAANGTRMGGITNKGSTTTAGLGLLNSAKGVFDIYNGFQRNKLAKETLQWNKDSARQAYLANADQVDLHRKHQVSILNSYNTAYNKIHDDKKRTDNKATHVPEYKVG